MKISNVKQFLKSLFVRDKKGFDISSLIGFTMMLLLLQFGFIEFGQYSKWYVNLTFFLIIVIIIGTILSVFEKLLSKILGKLNKQVKFRYVLVVCIVTSFITAYYR